MSILSARRALALTVLAAALGCGRDPNEGVPPVGGPTPSAPVLVENVPVKPRAGAVWHALTVIQSTQGRHADLRIGLGNVTVGADGLQAGLWIYVRGQKAQNRVVAARAGQTLRVAGRDLYVEEIKSGPRGSVRLLIAG